eukprot:SAG22_NODE_1163_length_5300_cov_18.540088_5_plen_184_part_01
MIAGSMRICSWWTAAAAASLSGRLGHAGGVGGAASAAAADGPEAHTWHPVAYVDSGLGYDDHDAAACVGHDRTTSGSAECAVLETGAVELRGCVQCKTGNRHCFDKPDARFATLPPQCRIDGTAEVKVRDGTIYQGDKIGTISEGSEIRIGADGGMRLAKGQEQAWMIRLRSIQIPTTIQRVED